MPEFFVLLVIFIGLLLIIGFLLFPYLRLRNDYRKCELIIKESSKTFYQAFHAITDKNQRVAIYAVYAFCRLVDDAVDIKKSPLVLENLENQLKAFVFNKKTTTFTFRALKDTAHKFYPSNYDYKPFFDMIEGQKMDLNPPLYKTMDELNHYCDLVASSVGQMLLPILAPENHKKLNDFAINLGRAMQLTNILRDVGEDFQLGRIYIPSIIMEKYAFILQNEMGEKNLKSFVFVFEELAKVAEEYYRKSEEEIHLFPIATRLPLHASLRLYKAILGACRQNNYNVFTKRNFISKEERNKIVDDLKKTYEV